MPNVVGQLSSTEIISIFDYNPTHIETVGGFRKEQNIA
jgi:hypothetical protein